MVEFDKNLSKSRMENSTVEGQFQDQFGDKKLGAL